MEDVFKTLDLSDDNENFRGYTTMIDLYNALKFITMLLFIQKTSRFNLGVAFLKSVSIFQNPFSYLESYYIIDYTSQISRGNIQKQIRQRIS